MQGVIGLFLCSILWVFIIGFQSRAVNAGQYVIAAPVSFFLGFLQVQVLGDVLSPEATMADTLIYCTGGMIGIVVAIWFHQNILPRFMKDRKIDRTDQEHKIAVKGVTRPEDATVH